MSNLRAALTAIYEDNGYLTPQAVVDAARPKGAELHDRFEWNDKIGAEQYRLVQARRLIISVDMEYTDDREEGERKRVRAFSALRQTVEPEHRGYRPTEEILADPLAAQILLRECQRAIADLKRKYGHLKEFRDLLRRELGEDVS